MDPLSLIKSLFCLARSLGQWLDQMKEKDVTISAISAHVTRICSLLAPFQKVHDLDPQILQAFLGLADALARTKEHLLVFQQRDLVSRTKDLLNPWRVTKLLREDEHQLSQQLIVMLFSVATVGYFKEHSLMSEKDQGNFVLCAPRNETTEFWREAFGAKLLCVPDSLFCEALSDWFGHDLHESTLQTLLFRLDEYGTGRVSLFNLEAFVGTSQLKESIKSYQRMARSRTLPTGRFSDPNLRLILWIDDNPANTVNKVVFARMHHVTVLQFLSTALAKDWIEDHEEYLRQNDIASRIRFISDNVRFETDPQSDDPAKPFLNLSAGENIVRFLRGRLFRAPILVHCFASINETDYVRSYRAAGSSIKWLIVQRYIMALAEGRDDDSDWMDMDV